jgi:hypothetical protein
VIRFYLRRKSIGGIFDHGHKGLPDQSATELSKAAIIEKYLPLPAVVDSAPPSAATKALKVDDKRIMRLDLEERSSRSEKLSGLSQIRSDQRFQEAFGS